MIKIQKIKSIASIILSLLSTPIFANDCLDAISSHVTNNGKWLELDDCDITDNNISTVVQFVNSHQELTAIFLAKNDIHSDGAKKMATLKTANMLWLNMNSNYLGDAGAAAFANSTGYDQLDFANNQIGDSGAIELSRNRNIVVLELTDNRITAHGATAIAENPAVRFLDIEYNMLGNVGAIAIAKNPNIEQLRIAGNDIGDEGAIAFSNNQTVQWLDISYNNINKDAINTLKNTKTITYLFLNGNPGSENIDNAHVSSRKLSRVLHGVAH